MVPDAAVMGLQVRHALGIAVMQVAVTLRIGRRVGPPVSFVQSLRRDDMCNFGLRNYTAVENLILLFLIRYGLCGRAGRPIAAGRSRLGAGPETPAQRMRHPIADTLTDAKERHRRCVDPERRGRCHKPATGTNRPEPRETSRIRF